MNDEMKRILSRYFLVSVIIACLTLSAAGTLTAKQRSEYNSYRREYAVLTLKAQGSKVDLKVDDKQYSLDFLPLKKAEEYKRWLYFTPFSTVFFFGESVYEFFSAKVLTYNENSDKLS